MYPNEAQVVANRGQEYVSATVHHIILNNLQNEFEALVGSGILSIFYQK